MMDIYEFHGVEFTFETFDMDEESACKVIAAACEAMDKLSAGDIHRIAEAWADEDASAESRNNGDDIAAIIETIECDALAAAGEWIETAHEQLAYPGIMIELYRK